MITSHAFLPRTCHWVMVLLLLFSLQTALAGTFMNLEPGVSTKVDVDRVLGRPTRVVVAEERYEYEKKETQTRRIMVTYYPNNKVIEHIDIHPLDSNTKGKYKSWLNLKQPQKKSKDANGNYIEYYMKKGVALYCDGPDDTATVRYFSHFDPASLSPGKTAPAKTPKAENRRKDAQYYIDESDVALEEENWPHAKKLIMEGLRKYPTDAELWHNRAAYYVRCKNEPKSKRRKEAFSSMYRAYKLNPSGKFAGEMAWLHHKINNDCMLALSYYEEAERKGLGIKNPGLFYWMGTCYEKLDMFSSAKTYYHRFLKKARGHEKRSDAKEALARLNRY